MSRLIQGDHKNIEAAHHALNKLLEAKNQSLIWFIEMGRWASIIKTKQLYKYLPDHDCLGFSSMHSFINSLPELSYSYVNFAMRAFDVFEKHDFDTKNIDGLTIRKLIVTLPALESIEDTQKARELLARAESLSETDLRISLDSEADQYQYWSGHLDTNQLPDYISDKFNPGLVYINIKQKKGKQ